MKVIQNGLARLRIDELVVKKGNGFFQQVAQPTVLLFSGLFQGAGGTQLHAGALSQPAQCLGEIPAFFLHHKSKDIAALIALAEAAPGAGIREDDKGGGARVAVEWAEAREIFPRPAQLHGFGDQVYDIEASLDFFYAAHLPWAGYLEKHWARLRPMFSPAKDYNLVPTRLFVRTL